MFSKKQLASLEDILCSINFINDLLTGIDLEAYRTDRKTRWATERLLGNLTEAVYRLGREIEQLHPDVDWRSLRGLGNVLRHEYDQIDDEVIWRAIKRRLPSLKTAVEAMLDEKSDSP